MSADRRRKRVARGELTPGQHLRAEIERLGLDQIAVSHATGVSRQSINNIVNDRQPISRAMAGKLGRLTGHGSDYWLRDSFSHSGSQRAMTATSGVLVNHQITRAVRNGIIVAPFDAGNVHVASIDLTLASDLTTIDGDKIDLARGRTFALKGSCAISACTKERIELPHDHVGRIGAIADLATRGVLTSVGFQIAPGFRGHVAFTLFNAGRKTVELRSGMPVIGLEIVSLSTTPSRR